MTQPWMCMQSFLGYCFYSLAHGHTGVSLSLRSLKKAVVIHEHTTEIKFLEFQIALIH